MVVEFTEVGLRVGLLNDWILFRMCITEGRRTVTIVKNGILIPFEHEFSRDTPLFCVVWLHHRSQSKVLKIFGDLRILSLILILAPRFHFGLGDIPAKFVLVGLSTLV